MPKAIPNNEPENFNSISLSNGVVVYGLSNPKNNNHEELQKGEHTTEAAVLYYLHDNCKVDVVISLHETHDSQPAVNEVDGLNLVSIPSVLAHH